MNILFYCAEYPPYKTGGIGSVTKIVAEELVKRGHNIYVVGYYPKNASFLEYSVINGVHIYRLNLGYRLGRIRYFLFRVLHKLKLSFFIIQKELEHTEKFITKLIDKHSVDVLELTDYYTFSASDKSLSYRKFHIPTVLRLHGSMSFLSDLRGEKKLNLIENDSRHFSRCDYISAVSQYSLNWVKGHYPTIKFKDEQVIYNPLEDKFLNKTDSPVDTKTILFLGKIVETKGAYSLLKAFNVCAEADKDIRLRLIGGENIEKAKTLVDSEFRDRVDFLGYCNRETIKREIDSCSFACIPSYFETFGMVALEIMSRNKALIFTERTAGREIIIDGVDGLLVNPKDINQIANKIQLLLNDKYYRDQIAEKGYNKIKEKFVVSKIVSQLEDFYKDIALLK